MYYRVTKVQHRPGARQQMIEALESKKDLMESIVGLKSVRLIEISDTSSMGISLYENAQQVIDAEEKFKELMGGMKPLMTGPPEISNGAEFWKSEF